MAHTRKFHLALAGGTFDRFHRGHEAFLRAAFAHSEKVLIGIATDGFASKKALGRAIEKFQKRKAAVKAFLKKNNFEKRSRMIPINDVFGPNCTDGAIDAIVVTKETRDGAMKINAARKKAKVKLAKIIPVKYALSTDGRKISSTRIRKGEISREGKVYLRRLARALRLPSRLIGALRRPLGKFFSSKKENGIIAAWGQARKARPTAVAVVGDACYGDAKSIGITPDLAIVDGKRMRKAVPVPKEILRNARRVTNRPGTVSPKLTAAIRRACAEIIRGNKPQYIIVRGEEDLAALPAILALPLGAVLFYGMPKEGVVRVDVGEDAKALAFGLLERFEK